MVGRDDESDGPGGGGGTLSDREASELSWHVAELGRAGLPMPSGLRALAEEAEAGPMRRVLEDLAGAIEAGRSLDEAVAEQGDRLPAHLRGLILAGVRTGRLGEVLERIARQNDLGAELRRGLWMTLAYPLALLALVSALFLFAATMIVRPFGEIFRDFGIDPPSATMTLIQTSDAASEVGLLALVASAGGLLLIGLAIATLGRVSLGRSLTSRVPLFGPLRRWTGMADFARLLGLLLEAEVPLPEALGLAGVGLRDRDIVAACRGLRAEVEQGRPLSEAVARRRELPAGLARLLGWAEAGRSLPEALGLAGDLYEARARAQARFAAVACTTLVIVAVLCGVVFMVVALFLPLIQLIVRLSG